METQHQHENLSVHADTPSAANPGLLEATADFRRSQFAERYFRDRRGRPWECRAYQRASLESRAPRKIHCDGRDVGKTTEIEIIACWAMMHCPGSEMLIATQCENHLYPIMHRITRRLQNVPEFANRMVESRQTPGWHFRFNNGFVLWGRIAGPRGINFQGLHVDWQIVDEAQEMSESAWAELYQSLNGDGIRWVYGVPNGLRNTFHRMTELPGVELHRWSSKLNPEFTDAKDTELAQLYGGRSSPGYRHRVLGEHGEPAHAVFSLEDYLACVDHALPVHDLVLRESEPLALSFGFPKCDYYLGCDLGYARDPSEFVIYRNEPPHLTNVLRLRLENVSYARQHDILLELDSLCHFRGIGIDAGSNGRAVAHHLQALGNEWCEKVHSFEFGGTTLLPELPDGTQPRRRTKELMTQLLQQRMAERSLRFPAIPDREAQYASHTYATSASGLVVYTKGNDHLIDADRCAVLCHYLDTTEIGPSPVPARGLGIAFWE